MTQDAYESKTARFDFRYATIEHATKADFEAFRKTGPANLLPPHQTDWMTGPTDPVYREADDVPESVRRNPSSGWWKTSGRVCTGVVRTRLGERDRAILHDAWPKDHPDYWTDADLSHHLPSKILRSHPGLYHNYVLVTEFRAPPTKERPPEVFPIAWNQALPRLTAATSPIGEADILIGDGMLNRGQVFCDVFDSPIVHSVMSKFSSGCIARLNGLRLPLAFPSGCVDVEMTPIFYRDQYIILAIHDFNS